MVLAVAVDRKVLIDAAVGAPQLGAPQLVAQGVVQRWQIPKVVVVVGGERFLLKQSQIWLPYQEPCLLMFAQPVGVARTTSSLPWYPHR